MSEIEVVRIRQIVEKMRSPHADKIYVGKEYTKADVIDDLEALLKGVTQP